MSTDVLTKHVWVANAIYGLRINHDYETRIIAEALAARLRSSSPHSSIAAATMAGQQPQAQLQVVNDVRAIKNPSDNELNNFDSIIDYLAGGNSLVMQAVAIGKQLDHELQLGPANAAVYLLSTFAGFGDPTLGNTIATLGNAAIQINEAVNRSANCS